MSRLSEVKVPVAEAHARAFGAELILLHVLPPEASRETFDLRLAAQAWAEQVYGPVARKIRRTRLLQRFPGERTADVFLRVVSIREPAGADGREILSWEDAIGRMISKESVLMGSPSSPEIPMR